MEKKAGLQVKYKIFSVVCKIKEWRAEEEKKWHQEFEVTEKEVRRMLKGLWPIKFQSIFLIFIPFIHRLLFLTMSNFISSLYLFFFHFLFVSCCITSECWSLSDSDHFISKARSKSKLFRLVHIRLLVDLSIHFLWIKCILFFLLLFSDAFIWIAPFQTVNRHRLLTHLVRKM